MYLCNVNQLKSIRWWCVRNTTFSYKQPNMTVVPMVMEGMLEHIRVKTRWHWYLQVMEGIEKPVLVQTT